jgi:hypothetical protein
MWVTWTHSNYFDNINRSETFCENYYLPDFLDKHGMLFCGGVVLKISELVMEMYLCAFVDYS